MEDKTVTIAENENRTEVKSPAPFRRRRLETGHAVSFPSSPSSTPLAWRGFASLAQSGKLFVSLFLMAAGFSYVTLLGSIWYDTEMNIRFITEGYGDMGNIELVQHSFRYLFWFFGIFAFTGGLFLLTGYSENLKRFMAVSVPLIILTDIGSAWGIRYSAFFSYTLMASGLFLAVSFLFMFLMLQYDLWFRKTEKVS